MTDLDTIDLFAPAGEVYGVDVPGRQRGRYYFPPPPGESPGWHGTFMRMTNLVSAFSDQEALTDWMIWKIFEGLRAHDVIFDEWMAEPLSQLTDPERKKLAKLYGEKAQDAAKADEGRRRGTARHLMVEEWFTGGRRNGTSSMLRQLDSLIEALDKADLEVFETEMHLWHPAAGGTMGRSDARVMCRRTGQTGTLDLKTQAKFWTYQELCGQLYGYDSAPWRWEGPLSPAGRWAPAWPEDRRPLLGRPGTQLADQPIGLIAHMPQEPGPGQLPVTIKAVPLAYGAEVLACAERNVQLRAIGKSARFPVEDF